MKKNFGKQEIDESDGFENDLRKLAFKTPLVFINGETKVADLLYLTDEI